VRGIRVSVEGYTGYRNCGVGMGLWLFLSKS